MPENTTRGRRRFMVPGDVDGFLGLALDNLIQFLLILSLCRFVLGMEEAFVLGTILPGAALSLVIGNIYYTMQARRLAERTGRDDVTALPYGINTVSLFAYVFLVMLPAKLSAPEGATPEQASRLAWQAGLCACLVSGVIETGGAFVADWIRKATPRAALLSTLAGIAISFIAIDFALRSFEIPIIAFLPLAVILGTYFSGVKMPLRLPGGVWAVLLGAVAAWTCFVLNQRFGFTLATPVSTEALRAAAQTPGLHLPVPVIGDVIEGFSNPIVRSTVLAVMVPMGLFNVLGSLQNIESAEAAGDQFPTRPSLIMNGAGTIVAAGFGSPFPTTIYIGHPGWKAMGARSAYSLANGVVFAIIALFGLTGLISALIPKEAGMAIVLYIGIVIAAQAFTATPRRHAPAVAIGLFPAIAAWGLLVLQIGLGAASSVFATRLDLPPPVVFDEILSSGQLAAVDFHLDGLVALSSGFMLTCMIWSSMTACLIDHRPRRALWWALAGAGFSFLGLIHTGTLSISGVVPVIGLGSGWPWTIGYALLAALYGLLSLRQPDTLAPAGDELA